ncbi:MAG: polyphosphate kinase 1 [Bacteroidetes bacterium]|nr:polyphosphate kinase 1 [Bacteroidota bacterium]MDA1224425.1 polyphosphate kinase 1 [Bacteroidota bacterium]
MGLKKQGINRDISWLAFNGRVLQEAADEENHIYDRLRFLGIFSNNLDEFFRVRVGTLNRMTRTAGNKLKMHLEENPEKILASIMSIVLTQQQQFEKIYRDLVVAMEGKKIHFKTDKQLTKEQKIFVETFFEERLHTRIVPLMIESIPSMPLLRDRSVYLACVLGHSQSAMMHRYALIEIPVGDLPRVVVLPSAKGTKDIILLEDIVRYNLPYLFAPFGFDKFMGHLIKVTRDAELDLDNDFHSNLIDDLEKGINNRKKGKATRFVYDKQIDANLLEFMMKRLSLNKKDHMVPGGRIHNFKDFMDFPREVFTDINSRPKPFVHPLLTQPCRIIDVISKKDVMLHFPYHSFDSVIDLLREAAIDPAVVSIRVTLYRLAKDSRVINALVNAVRNGKQVSVVIELKARFDEEANMMWKKRLEEEGVKVYIGLPEMKIHAKICVIKRREFNRTTQFGFVSTGNLNESTAKVYADHCLLTSNRQIMADINRVFDCLERPIPNLTGLKRCRTLIHAPITMRKFFQAQILKQISLSKRKKGGSLVVKLNSLSDDQLIHDLYAAAKAGVKSSFVVRGIFCGVMDQKSFKKQPQAISIVDQYLEHARVFIFGEEEQKQVFISSADWMVRNLDHRVEVACHIIDKEIQTELSHIMNIQLKENEKARILNAVLSNQYVVPEEGEPWLRSQVAIHDYLKNKEYTIESRSH